MQVKVLVIVVLMTAMSLIGLKWKLLCEVVLTMRDFILVYIWQCVGFHTLG